MSGGGEEGDDGGWIEGEETEGEGGESTTTGRADARAGAGEGATYGDAGEEGEGDEREEVEGSGEARGEEVGEGKSAGDEAATGTARITERRGSWMLSTDGESIS